MINYSSNVLDGNLSTKKASTFLLDSAINNILLIWCFNCTSELALKLRDHLKSNFVHLEAVFQILKRLKRLLHLHILVLNKLFFAYDIIDDLIKKHIDSLLLLVLDFANLLNETLNIVWWSDINIVFLALIKEIGELSLSIFAKLDLRSIFQVIWRLFLVQIKKMAIAFFTELIHNIPCIINWYGQLI